MGLYRVKIPINANEELIPAGAMLDDSKAEKYGLGDEKGQHPKAALNFPALIANGSLVRDDQAEAALAQNAAKKTGKDPKDSVTA